MPLAACGVTHPGRRSTNEDAWLVDLDLGLLVVADGMGGHNAGEVASGLAVKAIRDFVTSSHEPPSGGLLARAVQYANDQILSAASQDPEHAGMGTTVVAALIVDDKAYYTSVGDSRIYLCHGGQLVRLTRDDSWLSSTYAEAEAAMLADVGTHPMRHVLTKVVGLNPDLESTAVERTLAAGDCLLLCSDGVHGAVPDALLTQMLSTRDTVVDIAESVVRSAIDRGASDNATAVIARLSTDSTGS